jgi:hypothetical protein
MDGAKRVYVSVPRDYNLDERQRVLKHAILDSLRADGLEPQEFQVSGLPLRAPYTFQAVRDIMARCHGSLILAFARWRDPSSGGAIAMPTVWNHFEGAYALAMKKEILVVTEQDVARDGITWAGGGQIILFAPQDAGPEWLKSPYAAPQIAAWSAAVKKVDDVFLAYSSKARATAKDISSFLSSRGVSVRDWELDFAPGSTILEELSEASKNCLGGIMLLTRDDELVEGKENVAAPRDNVIFEMGLFMEAKGRERVLVVREEGAKMPADIGGGIYLQLRDRNDISPIHMKLLDFIEKRI